MRLSVTTASPVVTLSTAWALDAALEHFDPFQSVAARVHWMEMRPIRGW